MPEEITQQLGFDATKAINALENLQRELKGFQGTLKAVGAELDQFNKRATPAVTTLNNLKTASGPAKTALTNLGKSPLILSNNLRAATDSVGSFAASTTSATGTTQHLVGSFGQAETAAAQAGGALDTTSKKLKKLDDDAKNTSKGITLSWRTIGRVIAAQAIVRTLSAITSAFRESQAAAKEFSLATAEAYTISTGALGDMESMSASVLELANNLGLTADEVAEGVYQTLSNQVVDAGDSLKFAAAASKLSIATNTDLKTAVNALSSVMNSYSLQVSETDAVANVLFKTIEHGRLRLDEFGDVLGRVSPLTAQLGISYTELSAAIAALTQKGVPAHTAITQLTQVSQKLLKPTAGLQALYEEWMGPGGSGPEAIRRFGGLRGVLLKMRDATAGNDVEFAKLLGRVRSIVGAMNLTTDSADALTGVMKDMTEDTDRLTKAWEAMEKSIGRRTVAAWADLGNLMVSVGKKILQVTTPMVELLTKFLRTVNPIPILLAAMAGGAYIYVGGALAATGATLSWAGAINVLTAAASKSIPILAAVAAAAIGTGIGKLIGAQTRKALTELEAYEKARQELSDQLDKDILANIERRKKEFAEINAAAGEHFSEMTRLYQQDFQEASRASKAVEIVLKDSLANIAKQREESFKKIRDAVLDSEDVIKKSVDVLKKTQQQLTDANIKSSERGLSARTKLYRELSRIEAERQKINLEYIKAGVDAEALAVARKKSLALDERTTRAVNAAENLKGLGLIRKSEEALRKVRDDRIRGEKTFQLKRQDLQDGSHRNELKNLEQQEAKLQELLKVKVDLIKTIKDDEAKSNAEREQDAQKVLEIDKQIAEVRSGIEDSRLVEELGLADEFTAAGERLEEVLSTAKVDWGTVIDDFQANFEARKLTAKVSIEITGTGIEAQLQEVIGDISETAEPGMLQSKILQQAQDNVQTYETGLEQIDKVSQLAVKDIEASLGALDPKEFYTRLDEIKTKASESMRELWAVFRSPDLQKGLDDARAQTPALEEWRKKLVQVSEELKKAIDQRKPLNKSTAEMIKSLETEAEQWVETGAVSNAQQNRMWKGFKPVINLVKVLNKTLERTEEIEGISPETYQQSVDILKEHTEANKKSAEEKAKELEKAGEVTTELGDGVETEKTFPAAVEVSTAAIASKTEQQKLLNDQLAKGKEIEASQAAAAPTTPGAAPGAPAPTTPTVDPTPKITTAKDAAAALDTKLGEVNEEAAQTTMIINGVETPLKSLTAPVTAIKTNLKDSNEALKSMSDDQLPVIIEKGAETEEVFIKLKEQVKATDTATQDTGNSVGVVNEMLETGVDVAGQMAGAMDDAAQSAKIAAAACRTANSVCSGGSVTAAHGGRYFAAGGRGTDTVPAWLTPGEFVINKRSARKFFPQLQAINAGQKPLFREQGGHVTSIGDIHVSVKGGDTPAQSVREIASGLRRELRRKTIKLH